MLEYAYGNVINKDIFKVRWKEWLTVWKPLNICTSDKIDLFIILSYLSFIPIAKFVGMKSMIKRKRNHGNHVVHIVTFDDNKCHRMRPFGGCNPEFGVNHVLRCLFMLRLMMFIFV